MPRRIPRPANSNDPLTAETPSELRRLIDDQDRRIARQEKRIQKIIINREGPADAAQALLDEMVKARDTMKARLAGFEQP